MQLVINNMQRNVNETPFDAVFVGFFFMSLDAFS